MYSSENEDLFRILEKFIACLKYCAEEIRKANFTGMYINIAHEVIFFVVEGSKFFIMLQCNINMNTVYGELNPLSLVEFTAIKTASLVHVYTYMVWVCVYYSVL